MGVQESVAVPVVLVDVEVEVVPPEVEVVPPEVEEGDPTVSEMGRLVAVLPKRSFMVMITLVV